MKNAAVARVLEAIADALELRGEGGFRVNAYREAARNVELLREDIEEIWEEGKLEEIPGVGTSIAQKIGDFLARGESPYLAELGQGFPPGLLELLKVPGLGPKKSRLLYEALGIGSLAELVEAARAHRIRQVRGLGAKSEENLLREAERLQQREKRLLLGQAWPLAEAIAQMLSECPFVCAIEPAGSIRRRKETIGDIDLLASSAEPTQVMEAFVRLPLVQEVLNQGPTKSSILTQENLQVDLRVVAPAEYGSALQHFTGSKSHNIAMRERAIRLGYKLNEYGLFRLDTNERVAAKREEDVYQALGLPWIPPELRENAGEIEAAERGRLPHLIELADIRGDLHLHTEWSDGHDSLRSMAYAARELGYEYIAVTDHSHSLGIAHGLDPERVREQGRLIEDLNRELAPFQILHGTELEIRMDGTLDYPDELLATLDYVGASVHSGMKQPADKMTARILEAFRHRIHTFNHPTGRLLEERSPYEFDFDQVLQAARGRGICLEVNGNPHRLDLKDVDARRARDKGVGLVLDTDAHRTADLSYMRYAVAIARRGWVEKGDVLNALPLEALKQRLRKSSGIWVLWEQAEPLALQHEGRSEQDEQDAGQGGPRNRLSEEQEGQ